MTETGKSYVFVLLALGVLAVALLPHPGVAQVPWRQSPESRSSILRDVERVLVDVTVTEADGSPVTGLERGNFQVSEDGVEQEILSFSTEDVPISIGIIFDMSGSMSDKVDESRQATLEFLKAANGRDEFFLVTFSDRAKLASSFTSDIDELQKRVMAGSPQGRTALLDAIYLGLDQLKGARYSRHALLVISDGGDNHSRYNKTQVRNALKEADCSLYAIGFFRLKDILQTMEELHGPGLLSELAQITGGHMVPVTKLSDLPTIAAKIGVQLRSRYVLGYRPSHLHHDGSWRRIKVKVVPPMNMGTLNVYARTGYYSASY